jgi:hypothetical protein
MKMRCRLVHATNGGIFKTITGTGRPEEKGKPAVF